MAQVSVIIPVYNAQDYIEECLKSVLTQTFDDLEVIVVDDGSTDNTLSVINRLAASDSRVRTFCQPNLYAGVARNKGISVATGDYLYFLDADDWIEPDAIEVLVNSAATYDSDIVVARSEGFDNQSGDTWVIDYALNGVPFDTPLVPADYAAHLFQYFMGWPWDKLYKSSFVSEKKLEFQSLRTTNDAYFVFCSLAMANTVSCCDDVLFHHRSNNVQSLEGSRSKSWHCAFEAMVSIREKLCTLPLSDEYYRSFCNWVMNYSYWTISTLPTDAASAYLDKLLEVVNDMPLEDDVYPCLRDRSFRVRCGEPKPQLLLDVVNLDDAEARYISTIREKDSEISRLQSEITQLREALAASELKTQEAYRSRSYRLGNMVMKPLHNIKDALH